MNSLADSTGSNPSMNASPVMDIGSQLFEVSAWALDRLRELTVQVDGTTRGQGTGNSKQQAQEAAAKAALTTFQVSFLRKSVAAPH